MVTVGPSCSPAGGCLTCQGAQVWSADPGLPRGLAGDIRTPPAVPSVYMAVPGVYTGCVTGWIGLGRAVLQLRKPLLALALRRCLTVSYRIAARRFTLDGPCPHGERLAVTVVADLPATVGQFEAFMAVRHR